MYGLPVDFDGSEFIGATLEEVLFASNVVSFGFGHQRLVSTVGVYYFSLDGNEDLSEERIPLSSSRVVALIGRSVEAVGVNLPGEFVLCLDHDSRLVFRDDSELYEAYSIATPSGEIFV